MNIRKQVPTYVLLLGVSLTVAAAAKTFAPLQTASSKDKKVTTRLPATISKVEGIEVISATIEGNLAVVTVRNNTNKAVVSIALETGDDVDSYGANKNGFNGDNPPKVVIEPYGITTVEMQVSSLSTDKNIRVAGVVYADGKEIGEKKTLEAIRGHREHEKAKAKKGDSPQ